MAKFFDSLGQIGKDLAGSLTGQTQAQVIANQQKLQADYLASLKDQQASPITTTGWVAIGLGIALFFGVLIYFAFTKVKG